ncbi:hypothetical protein ACL02S_20285 [Nocardia sp. 004]|uniref:hypothetical protein n=1 Tax=Nocardia sp. 004 TaxID=3385978 RepID=UPI00399FF61E
MTSGRLRLSSRNRFLAAATVALVGGVVYLVRARRPQQQEPAAAPPRIGHSRTVSASTP